MDRYESLGVVGEGSYGVVLKCRHKESGKMVAIKKFLESEDDQNVKKIAMREIRMLKRLRHENLINMIEFFRKKKRLYLVFEYVDHTVLDELESKEGGLEPNKARSHIFQVIRGVAFCHENQIIHRDVKPENVLVSQSGVVKLCDFGFARSVGGPNDSCTDYVATRWYRAPELLVGDTKYGREVDIWAIGCLLSEMLTGDPLFPGDSDIDQLYHIIQTRGEVCTSHRNLIEKNPMLSGLRLPTSPTTPLSSTHNKWGFITLDFIASCLEMSPTNRPTAEQLMRNEYFSHDKFAEEFLPQLKRKVQEEFGSSQIKTTSTIYGTVAQIGKKIKRSKGDGSPETIYSKTLPKTPQSQPVRSSLPKPAYVPAQLAQLPTNDTFTTFSQQSQTSLNNLPATTKPLNFTTQYLNNITNRKADSQLQFDNANYSFFQIHPLNGMATDNSNFLSSSYGTAPSLSTSSACKPEAQRAPNPPLDSLSPLRKEKPLKSPLPLPLWISSPRTSRPLQVHNNSMSNLTTAKDSVGLVYGDSSQPQLNSFSRHSHAQFDFNRHPYSVSLDRNKDHSSRDQSRDPLREIRDNGGKHSKAENGSDKREPLNNLRIQASGWTKPRLLNDDLCLPVVGTGNIKPSSPLKQRKTPDDHVFGRRGSRKKNQLTMPSISPIQRSSTSSAESFDFNHIASNLPFV